MAGSITVSSITLDSDNTFRILSNTGSSLYTLNSVNQSVTGNLSVDATGTTGIRAPSANTLAFYEGGVEAMRIDSSGNVGIGTSSPVEKLTVTGAISLNTDLVLKEGTTARGYIFGTSAGLTYRATSGLPHIFQNVGTELMRIDSSGSVGIGTSSPTSYGSANNTKFVVTGSGRADAWFVGGASTGGYAYFSNNAQTSTANTMQIGQGWASGTDNIGFVNTNGANPLLFATNGVERMRIDSSGNVLVNTTSSTGHKMVVQSAAGAGGIDCVGGATNGYYAMRVDMPSTNTYGVLFRNNGNNVGDIRINSSSTTYNTSSDYRLKEDIAPMTGALDKVSALKPVTYKWKSTGEESQGFIAHELQAVVPDCVTGEKDAMRTENYEITPAIPATYDEEGNELTPAVEAVMGEREVPDYQGVDTSFLVATLTAAIQELKAELDATKAEVQALKAK